VARKGGLGRGLGALIPGPFEAVEASETAPARAPSTEVDIERIVANPNQPRMAIDQAALDELTQSIREHGVIQPLLVSLLPDVDGDRYQLIAGERRLRAARAAGLATVPVTVRETTPQELLELALIENVQRADLSPLEEAHAYRRLVEEFGQTQREVALRVARSRTAVANTLRLLDLPDEVQASLNRGEITAGHARALLAIEDRERLLRAWEQTVRAGLSVRQIEQLVRTMLRPAQPYATPGVLPTGPARPRDPETEALAAELQRSLGAKVGLRRAKTGRGTLTIHFYSNEELDGILDRLGVQPR
jgi:ParB family chromosome partitioning protein